MNYHKADALLQGRCRQARKVARNTYLERDMSAIGVRLHHTRILTFYTDGRCYVTENGWPTMTTRDRINRFLLPGWAVGSGGREAGPATVLYRHKPTYWTPVRSLAGGVMIHPDGTVTGGRDYTAWAAEWRETVNANRRERYKERFWILKARSGGKTRKPLSVELIQAEQNVSTRTAMIKVYGLERFLVAVNAQALDTLGDYSLLVYEMSPWNHILALKMVCPSTKTVYIHPVAPECDSVSKALDWMFQCEGYLNRLQAEA